MVPAQKKSDGCRVQLHFGFLDISQQLSDGLPIVNGNRIAQKINNSDPLPKKHKKSTQFSSKLQNMQNDIIGRFFQSVPS